MSSRYFSILPALEPPCLHLGREGVHCLVMIQRNVVLFFVLGVSVSGIAALGQTGAKPAGSLTQACELGDKWNHKPGSSRGPECWPHLAQPDSKACGAGTEQSPIVINPDRLPLRPTALVLHYTEFQAPVWNTGHVVEVCAKEGAQEQTGCKGPSSLGGYITVGNDRYDLKEFHLHAPAEHKLAGARGFAMEVHLVHESATARKPNAVIGVWMKVSSESNRVVKAMIENTPASEHDPGAKIVVNPLDLLPKKGVGQYFSYDGSLTTPGCGETVAWMVAKETGEVAPAIVSNLHRIISRFPGYDGYQNNNRPEQRLNKREVVSIEKK